MSTTLQLRAHLAAVQVDGVLDATVKSYMRTLDMCIDEFHEQADARRHTPGYCRDEHREQRVALFARYRAAVVALGDVLVDLRGDLGVDRGDLPAGDPAARAALERLRKSDERHRESTKEGASP